MDVVDLHLDQEPPGESFAEFIDRNERLLDRHLLRHHYSAGLLDSGRARQEY
jgi:hypothetical protein